MDSNQKNSDQFGVMGTINVGNVGLSRKNVVSQELINTLYTKEEIFLLNEGVTAHEIDILNKLFGKGYIAAECSSIIKRLQIYNNLLKQIETNDNQSGQDPLKTIINTGGFLDSRFNEYWELYERDLFPYNKNADNGILVDLFSQGSTEDSDLLGFKIKNKEEYLFNPQTMICVDLWAHESNKIGERGINKIGIKDDCLRFIALLPVNSVNYVISGLDDNVIRSYLSLGKQYIYYLISEIYRTTQKGGIVTGIEFENNNLLESIGMKLINKKRNFYCYKKE